MLLWGFYKYFCHALLFIVDALFSDLVIDCYIAYTQHLKDPSIRIDSTITKISSIIQCTMIRSCSEFGRLYGHLRRGKLISHGFCRRFNWFGHMWSGAANVEYDISVKRFLLRIVLFIIISTFL